MLGNGAYFGPDFTAEYLREVARGLEQAGRPEDLARLRSTSGSAGRVVVGHRPGGHTDGGLAVGPAQRALVPLFLVAAALFLAQTAAGGFIANVFASRADFYGLFGRLGWASTCRCGACWVTAHGGGWAARAWSTRTWAGCGGGHRRRHRCFLPA